MRRLNLTGQVFGHLEVMGEASMGVTGATMWRCRCDCGNEVVVMGTSLKNGNTKSCGCTRKKNGGRPSAADKKYLWASEMTEKEKDSLLTLRQYLMYNGVQFNEQGFISKGRQYNARNSYDAIVRALDHCVNWRS